MRICWLLLVAFSVTACASSGRDPRATSAANLVDPVALQAATGQPADGTYQIGATDLLKVTVFQVPDLSFEEMRVDASGSVEMPLIGSVRAAGLTPSELSKEIADRLGVRYLRDPRVNVTVVEAASQKVIVDGAVGKPGVYAMRGHTSLLQAVAMAEGPSRAANTRSVAIFRTVEGRRMVAVFDLQAIRNGRAADPTVMGDDVVVVDTSRLSAVLQDAISLMPAFAIFQFL